MDSSLKEYVQLAAPYLDASLVSPAEIGRILRIAARFPGVPSFGFESRLASPLPQADILLRFAPHDGSQRALHRHLEEVCADAATEHLAVWQAVRGFCRRWVEPSGTLAREVSAAWLELDLFGNPGELPPPCVFFDFARGPAPGERTIRDILALVHSAALPPTFGENLSRCIRSLPAGGRVFSLGAMFSRGPTAVRLCVSGIRPGELLAYLERIGWRGPVDEVAWMVERLAPGADWIAVALNVDDRILPKLGVELTVGGPWGRRQARYGALLDDLVAEGLSSPAKRNAVLAWCGHQDVLRGPEWWPSELRRVSAASGGAALSTFLRRISHLKLMFQPGQPMEAKAYLEFMHSWLQRDAETGRFFLHEVLSYARRRAPAAAGAHGGSALAV